MNQIAIHEIPRPSTPDAAPHPLLVGCVHAARVIERDRWGHDDFADGVASKMVRLVGSQYARTHYWAALPAEVDPDTCTPDQVLGHAMANTPLQEDTATAVLDVGVRPEHRSRGIGSALLRTVADAMAAQSRTLWQAYTLSPEVPAEAPNALTPTQGPGAVDASLPWHRWLTSLGWRLELCERPSTLALTPDAHARAATLAAQASDHAAGYTIVQYHGATPHPHAAGVAHVMERMVTDVPNGGMEFAEQTWTPERLAGVEGRIRRGGQDLVSTLAVHDDTGEVAGFTRLVWSHERPAGIWQEETLVLPAHRGHRLGLLVKAHNLAQLMRVNPAALRVHTWNAVENGPMLAINDALGFAGTGVEGSWQLRTDA